MLFCFKKHGRRSKKSEHNENNNLLKSCDGWIIFYQWNIAAACEREDLILLREKFIRKRKRKERKNLRKKERKKERKKKNQLFI